LVDVDVDDRLREKSADVGCGVFHTTCQKKDLVIRKNTRNALQEFELVRAV
jgi:hypothetical protein